VKENHRCYYAVKISGLSGWDERKRKKVIAILRGENFRIFRTVKESNERITNCLIFVGETDVQHNESYTNTKSTKPRSGGLSDGNNNRSCESVDGIGSGHNFLLQTAKNSWRFRPAKAKTTTTTTTTTDWWT
jgi:hypothetical protein